MASVQRDLRRAPRNRPRASSSASGRAGRQVPHLNAPAQEVWPDAGHRATKVPQSQRPGCRDSEELALCRTGGVMRESMPPKDSGTEVILVEDAVGRLRVGEERAVSCLTFEDCLHALCCFALELRHHVAVCIHCQGDFRVTEYVHDDPWRNALDQEKGGARVT